ncbi:efflux RND transporter periplasmic adaptor subunit [Klebsiella indica]|uniref:efflux RND transporter periplasmic adaptor subunit n=1 Tax=Klebsiella TaxID=570 RepID=UPI0031B6EC03
MTKNFPGLSDCLRQIFRLLSTPHLPASLCYGMLALPVILVLTACGDKPQKTPPAPRPVRTILAPPPSRSSIFTQTGEIRPHDEVTLGFRLDGRLLTRPVDVGDPVTAGETLGTLESGTFQNQLDSARADLDSTRAAERLAALNLRRMSALMPSGAIARVQLDSARSDWQTAVSRRQSAEAALNTARENLNWTHLIAPSAGIVTGVSAEPGQVVSAGQTVVTLAASNGRDAIIDVADPQVFSHNSGTFSVALIADPAIRASGRLRDISPQADPQTRTWRVRITLDNPPPAMALGASVNVELPGSGPAMMLLPASALTRENGKPAVFVVDRTSQQLQLRPVTLGGYTATGILVTSGVHPGEAVVTAGVSKLRQGEKVIFGEGRE